MVPVRVVEQTKEVQATDADGNLLFEDDGFTPIMEPVPTLNLVIPN